MQFKDPTGNTSVFRKPYSKTRKLSIKIQDILAFDHVQSFHSNVQNVHVSIKLKKLSLLQHQTHRKEGVRSLRATAEASLLVLQGAHHVCHVLRLTGSNTIGSILAGVATDTVGSILSIAIDCLAHFGLVNSELDGVGCWLGAQVVHASLEALQE